MKARAAAVLGALLLLAAGACAKDLGAFRAALAAARAPPQPAAVVLLEEGERVDPTASAGCKAGTKCPVAGVCCKGGDYCCPWGCNDDELPLTCKPNRWTNALAAAKNALEAEARREAAKSLYYQKQHQETHEDESSFKAAGEEAEKRRIRKKEKAVKARRTKGEEDEKAEAKKQAVREFEKERAQKRAEMEKKQPNALVLGEGMSAYERGYREPKFSVWNGLCLVSGTVKGKDLANFSIATLPPVCRPALRHSFTIRLAHSAIARYDVHPDGVIKWQTGAAVSGGELGHWMPLDGITFANKGTSEWRLPLQEDWEDYAQAGYQGAQYHQDPESKLCVVSGMIRGKTSVSSPGNTLVTLPPECRPKEGKLSFVLNHNNDTWTVLLHPNGDLVYAAGVRLPALVSLSTIAFFPEAAPSNDLRLEANWGPPGDGFRAPALSKHGSLCMLSGRAEPKPNKWDFRVAHVGSKCRPATRLMFTVVAEQGTQRVDVLPDGRVIWVGGRRGFVSLDGIRYVIP